MEGVLRVGVLGAGAVGCYYGARLAQRGVAVMLVGRPHHVDAIQELGVVIHSGGRREVVEVAATTDVAEIAGMDVVLVTVKSGDTEATADLIAGAIDREALVVSMQNGVDNAWRLAVRVPHAVVPAVVYVSTEMIGPGEVRHNGAGRLVVGAPLVDGTAPAATATLERLTRAFDDAGIPCTHASDIRVELWRKLATNCAYNALSALTGCRYGVVASHPETLEVMAGVVDELVAVAQADGVPLSLEDARAAVRQIAEVMPGALSSTAQDVQAGRRTEIAHLNGYVVGRGRALGVPAPVNHSLFAAVTLIEHARRPAGEG